MLKQSYSGIKSTQQYGHHMNARSHTWDRGSIRVKTSSSSQDAVGTSSSSLDSQRRLQIANEMSEANTVNFVDDAL